MRKAFVISLTLLLAVGATVAFAKAPQEMPRVLQGADITEHQTLVDPSVEVAAGADTFVFGPWDFNTGWQGWTSVDFNLNPEVYPHRTAVTSIPGGLGNGTVFTAGQQVWVGSLGSNVCGSKACYPGYQNGANQVLFKSYAIPAGSSSIDYQYRADSEPGYDYTDVIVSRAGCPTLLGNGSYEFAGTEADRDTLGSYTGFVEGTDTFDLSAYASTTICLIFNSHSDGGWSDDDCLYDSSDGMFQIDDIAVTSFALSTFEAGNDGWTFGKVNGLGNFAALEALSSLPNADPCPTFCGLNGNVVTIYDPTDPNFHPVNENEAIISPPLDLTINSSYPVGSYVVQFDVYANLPLANGNFYFWHVRYAPVELADCTCLDPNDWSPWLDENTIYFGGGVPSCGTAFQFNVSAKVPGHATKLQVSVGQLNYPPFLSVPGGNQSPYFDNISLRAAKVSAPAIVRGPWDYLQDAFPNAANFATAKGTPARVDNALNNDTGRNETRLGDSLITNIALSCNVDQATEVDVLFKIVPGPCVNMAHPYMAAYTAQPKVASGPYAGFAVARCDTAISANNSNAATAGFGTFMGAFHESAVAAGTTYAGLGSWVGLTGGVEGMSIFPDDVFTPGTVIYYVTHTTYIPVKVNGDYYDPSQKFGDGDGGRLGALEGNQKWVSQGGPYSNTGTFVSVWNALPHTTTDGTTNCAGALPAHCFLYVDRWSSRGPQFAITNAFRNLQIGWDQYNNEAPTSNMGNGLGNRFTPSNYANGDHATGPLPSLLNEVYTAILWNTGTNNTSNFSRGNTATGVSDAGNDIGLLDGWLRTNPTTSTQKYLWVSGDGNSRQLNATGNRLTFLNTTLGSTHSAAQYRDFNTAWGPNLSGLAGCATGQTYGLRGNWCPQRRSYCVLATNAGASGTATLDWKYPDVAAVVYGAGVNHVAGGALNFQTELNNWSIENLRAINPAIGAETNRQVTDWVARSLSTCFTGCFGTLTTVAVDENTGDAFVNNLKSLQNPLPTGQARISFTLAQGGHATVRVYDASGRAVSTVFDGVAQAGENSVTWNATGLRGGVYFYQVESNGFRSAKKIVLVQ